MQTDLQTLRNLAHLARLQLDESREQKLLSDLNSILEWVDKLRELDTTDIEPLVHLSEETNVLRADVAVNELTHEEALKNAPKRDSDYFRVPKVME
jgi:aspartyl-tRNA(Asn)/glutamyl-tRNA(Gln) amidotransferase subunit C